MWSGLRTNAPVVNGYSGRYPLHYPDWSAANDGSGIAGLAARTIRRVKVVIIEPAR